MEGQTIAEARLRFPLTARHAPRSGAMRCKWETWRRDWRRPPLWNLDLPRWMLAQRRRRWPGTDPEMIHRRLGLVHNQQTSSNAAEVCCGRTPANRPAKQRAFLQMAHYPVFRAPDGISKRILGGRQSLFAGTRITPDPAARQHLPRGIQAPPSVTSINPHLHQVSRCAYEM